MSNDGTAFGSGYRPDSQQYDTFFNQSGSFGDPHGHAVWHYRQNGQVIYDHMRDVQGNVYARSRLWNVSVPGQYCAEWPLVAACAKESRTIWTALFFVCAILVASYGRKISLRFL